VEDAGILLLGAIVLSLIGYAESDTVAEQFATKHRYDIRPDQELVALGAANVAAGLFQGFLAAGGASQTAASESAGAKTQLSGLIVSALILLTAVALMPLFTNLAQAVLGTIVISAVIGFINVPALRRIYHLRRESFVLAMIALFGVLIFGVLPGLILALLISMVMILIHFSRPQLSQLGQAPERGDFISLERSPDARPIPGLLVSRLDAPLFAFNAKHLRRTLLEQVQAADPPPRVVALDLEMTSDLDVESLSTLDELNRELRLQGKELWLAQVHHHAEAMLARDGLIDQIGKTHIFRTLDGAVAAFLAAEKEIVR
jgi:MFS superfamily sulfate permease-like transporter